MKAILDKQPEIEAYSPRIKFGGMFSNFTETSSIRLTAVYPEKEFRTTPLLPLRVIEGSKELKPGKILIPELLAKGMKVKVGDMVVIVATNQDGSVNGKQFIVAGIFKSVTGPGGRDGYLHMDDAREILRMEGKEISEFAIRLKDFGNSMDSAKSWRVCFQRSLTSRGNPLLSCIPGRSFRHFSTSPA